MPEAVQVLPGLRDVVTGRPVPAGDDGEHPAVHDLLHHPVDVGACEVDGKEENHPCGVGWNAYQVAKKHPNSPKKVLIIGGACFISHHIIGHIIKNTDWEIVSLDRLDYSGNLNRIADMMNEFDKETQKRVRIVYHDLRAEVNEMLTADLGKFDYIVHMAASSHVDRSIEDPMCFVLDNVVATCNILNFARKQENLERFIYFSTDEVFGPAPKGVNYKERDRYNSNS